MLSNFLQKPIGLVTVLGAAVGGPYAAFETDIGTQLRQSLVSRMAQPPIATNSEEAKYSTSDPYSLVATNGSNGSQSASATQNFTRMPYEPNNPSNKSAALTQSSFGNSAPSGGPIVSTVYGPATIQPIGPPMQHPMPLHSMPYAGVGNLASISNPSIETRSGPAAAVPGGTDQLWDYTLGIPTLNQIQQQPDATVGGGVVYDLREVLRFDIVPGWLPQRFARVSTVTSNVQMDGLRVPLITGTQPNSIAGTLTYYFDASQTLKRINLHGLTGDPSQLANLMVQYYQLRPEQSLGGQLFTTRWNNRITSVLQIAPAPIIYAGADHSKYIIFLELNQPTNQYGLSTEASEALRSAQASQRW